MVLPVISRNKGQPSMQSSEHNPVNYRKKSGTTERLTEKRSEFNGYKSVR